MKKQAIYFFRLSFIFLFLYITFVRLYNVYLEIPKAAFSPDEYAWVSDSKFYQYRLYQQWDMFKVTELNLKANWASSDYRLIDQPQMGKYIYGFFISKDFPRFRYENEALWFNPLQKEFGNFNEMWLQTGGLQLSELSEEIPQEWVEVILAMRWYSFFMFCFLLCMHFIFVQYIFNSKLLSLVSVSMLVFNKNLTYFSQLAMTDILSLFFVYSSFILLFFLFYKEQNLKIKKSVSLVFISGFLTAVATSIKPNGIFLFLIPILQILFQYLRVRVITQKIKKRIFLALLYILSFTLFFIFFEPEIFLSPKYGLYSLVMARVVQQTRFLHFMGNMDILSYLVFVAKSYFGSFENVLFLIIVLISFISGLFYFFRKEKNTKILILGLAIFFSNYLYARVGFERYLFPTYLLFTLISTYGLKELFRIIQKHD